MHGFFCHFILSLYLSKLSTTKPIIPAHFYIKKNCVTNLTYFFNVKQEGDVRDFVENSLQIFIPLIKENIALFILSSPKGKQIIYDPKLDYNTNEIKVVSSREGSFG